MTWDQSRPALLLDNVRLAGDPTRLVSVTCVHGLIEKITPQVRPADPAAPVGNGTPRIDGQGLLALPGLIDAHAHVDKTLFGGPWVPNLPSGSVKERIANERKLRLHHDLPNPDYIRQLVLQMVAHGTTRIRTHTDVAPDLGLEGIEAVKEVAHALSGTVDIEQVAFPQQGVVSNPGTTELLRAAVRAGARVIGGLDPAGFDNAPIEQLSVIFGIAADEGCAIDIHLHDTGSLGVWEILRICDFTRRFQLAGRVTISHAFAFGQVEAEDELIANLHEAGVSVLTGAVYDWPVPPLKKLAKHGIPLGAGSDGIRDLWGPYGNGDMLARANLIGYRSSARTDNELQLAFNTATINNAQLLGLSDYGLAVGKRADFVLVDAKHVQDAVSRVPPRVRVIKGGREVAVNGAAITA